MKSLLILDIFYSDFGVDLKTSGGTVALARFSLASEQSIIIYIQEYFRLKYLFQYVAAEVPQAASRFPAVHSKTTL